MIMKTATSGIRYTRQIYGQALHGKHLLSGATGGHHYELACGHRTGDRCAILGFSESYVGGRLNAWDPLSSLDQIVPGSVLAGFPADGTVEELGRDERSGLFRFRYTEGPKDKAFMEQRDRDYLAGLKDSKDPAQHRRFIEEMETLDLSLPHHQDLKASFGPDLEALKSRLKAERVAEISAELTPLRGQLALGHERLEALTEALEALKSDMKSQWSSLNRSIVEGPVSVVRGRIGHLEEWRGEKVAQESAFRPLSLWPQEHLAVLGVTVVTLLLGLDRFSPRLRPYLRSPLTAITLLLAILVGLISLPAMMAVVLVPPLALAWQALAFRVQGPAMQVRLDERVAGLDDLRTALDRGLEATETRIAGVETRLRQRLNRLADQVRDAEPEREQARSIAASSSSAAP